MTKVSPENRTFFPESFNGVTSFWIKKNEFRLFLNGCSREKNDINLNWIAHYCDWNITARNKKIKNAFDESLWQCFIPSRVYRLINDVNLCKWKCKRWLGGKQTNAFCSNKNTEYFFYSGDNNSIFFLHLNTRGVFLFLGRTRPIPQTFFFMQRSIRAMVRPSKKL